MFLCVVFVRVLSVAPPVYDNVGEILTVWFSCLSVSSGSRVMSFQKKTEKQLVFHSSKFNFTAKLCKGEKGAQKNKKQRPDSPSKQNLVTAK